ncbi:hypothetical protein HZH68_012784 [Vespula germanica]|uniref:Uncharacterized protein n=1 Tax=Vespula germanica TaxID=30212 RepID=A0A834MVQ5_VESGE|nr:hypothetical protein HZH68_012784 [Vespula germanica]
MIRATDKGVPCRQDEGDEEGEEEEEEEEEKEEEEEEEEEEEDNFQRGGRAKRFRGPPMSKRDRENERGDAIVAALKYRSKQRQRCPEPPKWPSVSNPRTEYQLVSLLAFDAANREGIEIQCENDQDVDGIKSEGFDGVE